MPFSTVVLDRAAARFWPGPLTLVLRRRDDSGLSLLASAGLDTVAIRVPAHAVAQALLHETGRPIAAPSANRSGRVSPTEATHVAEELRDRVALILDGGRTPVGLEFGGARSLRRGRRLVAPRRRHVGAADGVPRPDLPIAISAAAEPKSPGMLPSHYAPSLPLRLDAVEAHPGEALLAFGPDAPPGFAEVLWLSRSADLAEAAANLFAMLRRLDRPLYARIAVMPIPEYGLGRAINDRLRRAAAPRPRA